MKKSKKVEKKLRKVDRKFRSLPLLPDSFVYIKLYQSLQELYAQRQYKLVTDICNAILKSENYVQDGTHDLYDPWILQKIIRELTDELKEDSCTAKTELSEKAERPPRLAMICKEMDAVIDDIMAECNNSSRCAERMKMRLIEHIETKFQSLKQSED